MSTENEPSPVDPSEVIEQAEEERTDWAEHATAALEYLIDDGGLYERGDLVALLSDEFGAAPAHTERVLIHLIEDHVDPVQQISTADGRYVGVLGYAEHDGWWYAIDEYDGALGEHTRAVCGVCVHDADRDDEPFSRKDDDRGNAPHGGGVEALRAVMERHYLRAHADLTVDALLDALGESVAEAGEAVGLDFGPVDAGDEAAVAARIRASMDALTVDRVLGAYDVTLDDVADLVSIDGPDVEPGATLASGTTINSQTAWHDGNVSGGSNISIGATSVSVSPQGSGSGLDADTVDGSEASDLGGATARSGVFNFSAVTSGYGFFNFTTSTSSQATATYTITMVPGASGAAYWRGTFVMINGNGDTFSFLLTKNGSTFASTTGSVPGSSTFTTTGYTSYQNGDQINQVVHQINAANSGTDFDNRSLAKGVDNP